MDNPYKIEIQPEHGFADQALTTFKVSGLAPDKEVTIRARTKDEAGIVWMSWATFQSDAMGMLDISKQAPIAGTFTVADPSAFLWSLRPEINNTGPVPMFAKTSIMPLMVDIEAEVEKEIVCQVSIERLFASPENEVVREHVDVEGMTGSLFYPASKGPHPAIICLSGSGGGYNEARASLLAAHGYAALALAYFGAGSLPKELSEIPVEFIEKGFSFLRKHETVDNERIGVYGYSKGGELALLLASLYPQIKAVAAISGSAYVWQGIRFGRPGSSWTQGGKPLEYLPMKLPFKTVFKLMRGKPVAFRIGYERGLASSKNTDAATIAVEKINGPVFLVAGTDDQVWPAADFSDKVVERLKQQKHPHTCEYLREEGVGHLVCMPYLPSAEVFNNLIFTSSQIELSSITMIKSWNAMIAFFDKVI